MVSIYPHHIPGYTQKEDNSTRTHDTTTSRKSNNLTNKFSEKTKRNNYQHPQWDALFLVLCNNKPSNHLPVGVFKQNHKCSTQMDSTSSPLPATHSHAVDRSPISSVSGRKPPCNTKTAAKRRSPTSAGVWGRRTEHRRLVRAEAPYGTL